MTLTRSNMADFLATASQAERWTPCLNATGRDRKKTESLKSRMESEPVETECPRQTLRPDGGKTGDGSAPLSLSRTGIRRALAGLPASRRCSPRQAESPASQQGRPAPCGHWISSEAFQLAWAGGCATGPQTRSRHDCMCGPRLDHLARGQPPLLAVRLPRATGLAS